MNKTVKYGLWVYGVALILYIILRIMLLPHSAAIFSGVWFIALLAMMVIFEYLKFGAGTRIIIDVVICLGFALGIIFGLISNPDIENILTRFIPVLYPLVFIATFRAFKTEKA